MGIREGDCEGVAEGTDTVGDVLGNTDGGDEGDAVGGDVLGFFTFISATPLSFALLFTFVPAFLAFFSVLLTGS